MRPILANGLPSGMFRFNRTIQNQQQPGIPEETTKGSSGYASRGMIRLENALWSATLFRMGRSGLIGRSAGPIPATQGKCDIVRPSPIVACWPETHPSRLFASPKVREHPGCGGTRSGWFSGSPRRVPGRIPERWFPREDLDADSYAFDVLHGEDRRTRRVLIGAGAWFDRYCADKFELYEQTFKVADNEILTLLVFKDEVMLEEP